MFRVSTLDLANVPRDEEGQVDFGQDFFGHETNLTVSGQLNVESYCLMLSKVYTFGQPFVQRIPTHPGIWPSSG